MRRSRRQPRRSATAKAHPDAGSFDHRMRGQEVCAPQSVGRVAAGIARRMRRRHRDNSLARGYLEYEGPIYNFKPVRRALWVLAPFARAAAHQDGACQYIDAQDATTRRSGERENGMDAKNEES